MRRRSIIWSLLLLTLLVATLVALPSRQLACQYFAPQFTCACGHTMVLEFIAGKVRLHNLGHARFYEFGSFKTNGSQMIWYPPDYKTNFTIIPERFGLRAVEEQSGRSIRFKRSFKVNDTSGDKESKRKIKAYLGDYSLFFEQIPNTKPVGTTNGTKPTRFDSNQTSSAASSRP